MKRSYRYDANRGKMVEVTRDHPVRMRNTSTWPRECVASGVHPSQAGELRDFFAKHGESCEVTREGDPVYTSAKHRSRLLKLRGFYDKRAFG